MSWRTQSHYKGLSDAEREWVRSFDRSWDLKQHGRSSQSDAMDRAQYFESESMVPRLIDVPAPTETAYELEVRLSEVAGRIRRFTIPKRRSFGWAIFVALDNGKRCQVKFRDKADALQAYLTLQELYVSVFMS